MFVIKKRITEFSRFRINSSLLLSKQKFSKLLYRHWTSQPIALSDVGKRITYFGLEFISKEDIPEDIYDSWTYELRLN